MKIVVTGATGQLGSLVAQYLLKRVPAHQIIASAHNMDKTTALANLGIETRHGDYNDSKSLVTSFAGADRLLFLASPDAHDEPLRAVQHANVVKAARDAGIKHIVYTSMNFAEQFDWPIILQHLATEYVIRSANIPYTFLRNAFYTDFHLDSTFLKTAAQQRRIFTNSGKGTFNYVTRNDLAKATAVVLAEEGYAHLNKVYELVANQSWSYDDLAQMISEISGEQVVHENVSFDEMKKRLIEAGLPESYAFAKARFFKAIAEGKMSKTSSDLKKLIGELTPMEETVRQALLG